MDGRPLVSVILPVRDAAATVGRAVASIRAQTLTDWELIVVDDGSRDTTAEAVEAAAEGDPRIRLLRRSASGIVAALNAGLAVARGVLVARMDADDFSLPERLERQVALLEARPDVGVASCRVAFGGDMAAARGYFLHVEWLNRLCEPDELARERFVDAPVAHPSVMFRRELVDRLGGYRETGWPEDYELWLRWMDAGVRFAKVREVLLRWEDSPERLSRTDPRYGEDRFYRCKCHYLARWLRREVDGRRSVFLWGAGRVTRRRFAALAEEGVCLAGYVDVDAKKIGGRAGGVPVIGPEALPGPEAAFVVAGVGVRGARELIRAELTRRGYVEGRDFFVAA